MLTTTGTTNEGFWPPDLFDDGDEGPSMDLDEFFQIIGESPDPQQNSSEDLLSEKVSHVQSVPDSGYQDNSLLQNEFQQLEGAPSSGETSPGSFAFFPSFNSEASDSRTDGLPAARNFMVFNHGNPELSSQNGSFTHGFSGSLDEWSPSVPEHVACWSETVQSSQNVLSHCGNGSEGQYDIPNLNASSSSSGYANQLSDYTDNMDHNFFNDEGEFQLNCLGSHPNVTYGNSDMNIGKQILSEGGLGFFGASEKYSCTSMKISVMDTNISSHDATNTQSSCCQESDGMTGTSNHYSDMGCCMVDSHNHFDNPSEQCQLYRSNLQYMANNGEIVMKDEKDEILTENALAQMEITSGSMSDLSVIYFSDIEGFNPKYDCGDDISPNSGKSSSADGGPLDKKVSTKLSINSQACASIRKQAACVEDERNSEPVGPGKLTCENIHVTHEDIATKSSHLSECNFLSEESKLVIPDMLASISHEKPLVHAMVEKEDAVTAAKGACHSLNLLADTSSISFGNKKIRKYVSEQLLPSSLPSMVCKPLACIEDEREGKPNQPKRMASQLLKTSPEFIQSNPLDVISLVDDENDICILEDISQPPQETAFRKSLVNNVQHSTFNAPLHHVGLGGIRLKGDDERLIFRVALQDLSQPKSEISPPDGVLAVSLLRHQRIALSWMVQKEISGWNCCGGILADDQGLGKTISTIALILKERPPSSGVFQKAIKEELLETLNLDEDDDGAVDNGGVNPDLDSASVQSPVNCRNALLQSKGRPAAGTLIVCPTSVLRQWAEELHNKVTSKADLSVLVYHGSNRTKDPFELAKYDVVLTTYSIVSMEVPKQPLVDKDEDEKGNSAPNVISSAGITSNKKRKYPPSYDSRRSKGKKEVDGTFAEPIVRPLAKVGWFRVVLDEAQSIKNHRTQVARACWGLRAKRRWCLSGTPIQNAVDDLYSYFRFLKYEPYATYNSFCSTIKAPINRSPANGYRKLQAVLKTIMLRRTKGTLLDGEPIISLPPKSVELKKVDFSKKERDFYTRLEEDSRAQFEVYAAAGTVKQNYVNILLMLLRLRQACDHPLLVNGLSSNSVWKSSLESARKLPRERRHSLLSCLEASLAICGICNDPPEDAVVSVCGHVFCNQCISEHLTSEENHCPAANCKVQLTASLVLSRATLNSSLSNESDLKNSLNSSGSEYVQTVECNSECSSFGSSKIKAALEVLESLSKPQKSRFNGSSLRSSDGTSSTGNASDSGGAEMLNGIMPSEGNLVVDEALSDTVSVVGEKAIVFSQWTRMLDLLETCLKDSSIQYRRLDGTMSVAARDKAVKDFNSFPEVSVMIMSLKAASLGLNMVAACHVLLLDLWWNPTTEDQAIDRAHRIGQTRPVTVVRLTVNDTVEDRILALQQKKREMVASAFGEDETGSRQTRLTVEDLKYLFRS